MYSPVIDPQLIPALYHAAKSRQMPMPRLVDTLIFDALCHASDLPEAAHEALASYKASVKQTQPSTKGSHAQDLHVVQQEGAR